MLGLGDVGQPPDFALNGVPPKGIIGSRCHSVDDCSDISRLQVRLGNIVCEHNTGMFCEHFPSASDAPRVYRLD